MLFGGVKPYVVRQALCDEMESASVWITDTSLFDTRTAVLIEHWVDNKKIKSVCCECMVVDPTYRKRRDKVCEANGWRLFSEALQSDRAIRVGKQAAETIVMSAYYRSRLDVKNRSGDSSYTPAMLRIVPIKRHDVYHRIQVCLNHPQIAVRMATWIGIIGAALGVLGLLFRREEDEMIQLAWSALYALLASNFQIAALPSERDRRTGRENLLFGGAKALYLVSLVYLVVILILVTLVLLRPVIDMCGRRAVRECCDEIHRVMSI